MKKWIAFIAPFIVSNAIAQSTSVTESTDRTHNADNFVTQEKKVQSDSRQAVVNNQYARDLVNMLSSSCSPGPDALGLKFLADRNILDKPIETYTTMADPATGASVVTGGEIMTFYADKPYPKALYKLETEVPLTSFSPYHPISCDLAMDGHYKLQEKYLLYDQYGDLLEKQIKTNKRISYMYNYKSQYMVATVDNASNAQIAYTSFETGYKGYWSYDESRVVDAASIGLGEYTGRKAFKLGPVGEEEKMLTREGLPLGKYVVTFFQRTAAATPVLSVTGSAGSSSTLFTSYHIGGGWVYYEYRVSNTTLVKVNGKDYIDEVRLYPVDAQMTTAGFIPLVGVQYTCDVGCHVNNYSYDDLGRLLYVKDVNGKIIKKMEYGVKQPE